MALFHWQKEYYPNKKYVNCKFYDVIVIVNLYESDKTNGTLTNLTSDFAIQIFPEIFENPTKFVY